MNARGRAAPLPPGSTIGILGDGQLGRMLALAAAPLGYRVHIFGSEAMSPAAQVAAYSTQAGYDDSAALDAFAQSVDVVTLEFENIPVAAVERVARTVPVRPGARVLEITQDRLLEKDFVRRHGGDTADYRRIDSPEDIEPALQALQGGILKTRRMGYDGKGQARLADIAGGIDAFKRFGEAPCIVEAFVPFALEISVIVARALDGSTQAFVPVENRHENHILSLTLAPAPISDALAGEAERLACALAAALDLVGILAVEMFVTRDNRLLVNELAPRVHNSGHWTIEACTTSQFEQAARAVCGLPLGSPARHANAIMRNLIGASAEDWAAILADPAAKLHLYGKAEARPGRKMGHVTRLLPLGQTPRA